VSGCACPDGWFAGCRGGAWLVTVSGRWVDLTGDSACDTVVGVKRGNFLVRTSPALHEQLAALAAEQGVSVNQLVNVLLAGGIGFKLTES